MTQRRRPATAAGGGRLLLLSLLLSCAAAQPSPSGGGDNSTTSNNPYGFNTNFNPSMAIVIVVLISAFFFLGFFSIYIRQCGGGAADPSLTPNAANRAARSRRQRGLDPALLSTFPTLVYSEVKELKIGKGSLECAVCLSEFDDDETLRLLPGCSHVFHPDCIDAWLANHVTCPVCRSNLSETPNPQAPAADDPAAGSASASSSAAAEIAIDIQEERKEELAELARIGSRRRGGLLRSHSTGHSLVLVHERTELDNHDRFTLRLPESVRKEIVLAGRMRRAESSRGFPLPREGSSRRGYRGEGSARGGRSIRLGRSDRWPSFMLRNFSARMPAWATGWRSERDGSVKKGDERDGSARGRRGSVRTQFDCLGGAGGAGQELAAGPGRV